jgi:hypothetical protein
VRGVRTPSDVHNIFSMRRTSGGKKREGGGDLPIDSLSSFHLCCINLLGLFSLRSSSLLASNLQLPHVVMASALSSSRLRSPEDLRKLRKSISWQSHGYEDKVWCGIASLTGLRPDEFMYFTAYALARLVLPFSSFFMLLETNGLEL